MNKYLIITTLVLGMVAASSGQRSPIQITYKADNNGIHVKLDSIKVVNLTQGGDTVLYYPDTVLILSALGINDLMKKADGFIFLRNYPNPATEFTNVIMLVPERDKVNLEVTDLTGREVIYNELLLERGQHKFKLILGNQHFYILKASWRNSCSSIMIINYGLGNNPGCFLEYMGYDIPGLNIKNTLAISGFPFTAGDELLYIGYAGNSQSGIITVPIESSECTLQFAVNVPCIGLPVVEYERQAYSTVQVFSQCWLKENLNVGIMVSVSQEMADNGIIEKYCFGDSEIGCVLYGGLYVWKEAMQYAILPGTKGICPPGWHIPGDREWQILEGSVDGQFGIGDPEWIKSGDRGYNAGFHLRALSGWYSDGNGDDLAGFTGLPGGYRYSTGTYMEQESSGFWWTSSTFLDDEHAMRNLNYNGNKSNRGGSGNTIGFSVRCIKD